MSEVFLYPCETASGDLIEVWRNKDNDYIVKLCGLNFKFSDSRVADDFVSGLAACELTAP